MEKRSERFVLESFSIRRFCIRKFVFERFILESFVKEIFSIRKVLKDFEFVNFTEVSLLREIN